MTARALLDTPWLRPLVQFLRWLRWRSGEPFRQRSHVRGHVFGDDPADAGDEVRNVRVLRPAVRLFVADPKTDPFVPVGKYYKDGWCDHAPVYVCEVPDARVSVPAGMVCTRSFRVLAERGLAERVGQYSAFDTPKPRSMPRLEGPLATINYCFAHNTGHWLVDCLPRVRNFDLALPGVELTLLMHAGATEFQRETLLAVLPERFKVRWDVADPWLECPEFYWSSPVSARCMDKLPPEYLDRMTAPIFRKYGLPVVHRKRRRIYISRKFARYRRVLNEEELLRLLVRYGFEEVNLEKMSFREEVELFHEAEIVLGPHGAGFTGIFWSGDIDVVVLYSNQVPPNYFHSMAMGLHQRHHFVLHQEKQEDDNFQADIPAVREILENKLGLKPLDEVREGSPTPARRRVE